MTTCNTQEAQQQPKTREEERSELIRRTICPKGISEDEFLLFMEQCRRSGLDPLLKEAFCVARRQNIGNRDKPNWVTKHEFQPSEAGMLARAERFPDYRGTQASAVYAEDDIAMDQGKGEVRHVFNPAKRKGSLVGAWARVVREGKLPVVVWLDLSGYVQQSPLWAKMPTTMIEKCARVAALRKAYPEAFGGLYIREEMPAEEYEDAAPRASLPAKTATREALEVAATVVTPAPSAEVVEAKSQQAPLTGVVFGHEVRAEEEAASKAAEKPGPQAQVPGVQVVAFGPHKGVAVAKLTDAQLSESIDLAQEKLLAEPKARWAKAMRENLAGLEAEAELRCRVPAKGPALVAFGELAGEPIADLSDEQLAACIDEGIALVGGAARDDEGARKVRGNLEMMKGEKQRRAIVAQDARLAGSAP